MWLEQFEFKVLSCVLCGVGELDTLDTSGHRESRRRVKVLGLVGEKIRNVLAKRRELTR